MNSDELVATLINSVESLSNKFDNLEIKLKKLVDVHEESIKVSKELNTTIFNSNKIFEQVATGVKDLYEKVKTLEIVTKLLGNLGSLGPLFGGVNQPKKG